MRLTAKQIALHDDQRDLGAAGRAALVRAFGRLFPAAGRVLDAGGGTGWAVPLLEAAGLTAVLADLSADMLAAAVTDTPRVRGDLTALPFAGGGFDGVHASYAIQNVPDWTAAICECVRVLRPDGVAVVAWGGPSPDPMIRDVSAFYFAQLGQWAGTAGQRQGLSSTAAGAAQFERAGCAAIAPVTITGGQTRSLRQLVVRMATNPFRGDPPADLARAARATTLAWAAKRYGDLDRPRTVEVAHVLYGYRRL